MTNRSDYADAEWQILLDIPPAVGTAVMHAGQSGVGTVKESFAMVNGIMRADQKYEGVELIESLVEARLKGGEKSEIETLSSPYAGLAPEKILEDAVARCKQAAKALSAHAEAEEADAFVDWALSVGKAVAVAAKEGGFLGFGGERVSEEERHALTSLRDALLG